MRRRVVDLVGADAHQMWVSTFHSAGLRMLRAHAEVLGYQRGFTIYDAGDAETAVERIMKELGLDTKRLCPRSVVRGDLGGQERDARRPSSTPTRGATTGPCTGASPRSTACTRNACGSPTRWTSTT